MLSIIIVNYNTWDLVYQCVISIQKYTKIKYELIIVDNASSKTDEYMDRFTVFNDVRIIQLSDNIGFGKANNVGVEYSSYEYILFLNSDTIIINDSIDRLFFYMQANPNVGACGANLYTKDLQRNMSFSSFPKFINEIKEILGLPYRENNIQSIFNIEKNRSINGYISGADLLVKRSCIKDYFFDPFFFMYYEDVELCSRIKKSGFEIHSVSDAQIIHLQGMSSNKEEKKDNFFVTFHLIRSKLYYFKLNCSFYCLLFLLYKLKSLIGIITYSVIDNSDKKYFWKKIFELKY